VSLLRRPYRCNYNDFERREIRVLRENPDEVAERLLRRRPKSVWWPYSVGVT
jgi:hypothetical protein